MWKLFKETIPLARLIDSSEVLCYSAKWYGEKEIYFDSIQQSSRKEMLKGIHSLLDEADVLVHYNGNSFDIPCLNKEFVLAKMAPPSPSKSIDLLKVVRSNFRFVSNKLDYVASKLGLGKKNDTNFQLWVDCMHGKKAAWATMRAYNIQDTLLLERLYERLKPWIRNHPNSNIYSGERIGCPTCGSKSLQPRGYSYTKAGKYQRSRCRDCGSWSRSTKGVPTGAAVTNILM